MRSILKKKMVTSIWWQEMSYLYAKKKRETINLSLEHSSFTSQRISAAHENTSSVSRLAKSFFTDLPCDKKKKKKERIKNCINLYAISHRVTKKAKRVSLALKKFTVSRRSNLAHSRFYIIRFYMLTVGYAFFRHRGRFLHKHSVCDKFGIPQFIKYKKSKKKKR